MLRQIYFLFLIKLTIYLLFLHGYICNGDYLKCLIEMFQMSNHNIMLFCGGIENSITDFPLIFSSKLTIIYLLFSREYICCDAYMKCLIEMFPMSTHNICFCGFCNK